MKNIYFFGGFSSFAFSTLLGLGTGSLVLLGRFAWNQRLKRGLNSSLLVNELFLLALVHHFSKGSPLNLALMVRGQTTRHSSSSEPSQMLTSCALEDCNCSFLRTLSSMY